MSLKQLRGCILLDMPKKLLKFQKLHTCKIFAHLQVIELILTVLYEVKNKKTVEFKHYSTIKD